MRKCDFLIDYWIIYIASIWLCNHNKKQTRFFRTESNDSKRLLHLCFEKPQNYFPDLMGLRKLSKFIKYTWWPSFMLKSCALTVLLLLVWNRKCLHFWLRVCDNYLSNLFREYQSTLSHNHIYEIDLLRALVQLILTLAL